MKYVLRAYWVFCGGFLVFITFTLFGDVTLQDRIDSLLNAAVIVACGLAAHKILKE